MYVTASLETRKALTSRWEGLQHLYERYHELNNQDSRDLSAQQKRELTELREKICHQEFDRVESPTLRIQKFVHIGDNSKRFECDELSAVSKRSASQLADLTQRFQLQAKVPGEVRFSLKLQGRLMVNHTGGILENAGLCLHPHAGIPYIPGSAVKGVARHAAWSVWADAMGANDETAAQNAALKTVLIFGFPTNDETGLDAYCMKVWPTWFGKGASFETLAGLFAFMPAMPLQKMEIVTDIVNGHHANYYKGEQQKPVGNEKPNPQFFPAVEKGALFSFTIRPTRRMERVVDSLDGKVTVNELRQFAEKALRDAAEEYGFGSKTSNGYGWFFGDVLAEAEFKARAERTQKEAAEKEARQRKEAEAQAARDAKKAREEKLSRLSPAERAEAELLDWADGKWSSTLSDLKEIERLPDEQKNALVRLLACTEKARWEEIKQKVQSGKSKEKKRLQPVRDELYRIAKQQSPKVKMP